MNRKTRLSAALTEEKARLMAHPNFDPTDHELAVEYLTLGTFPKNYEKFEILDACINDFDSICNDYQIAD